MTANATNETLSERDEIDALLPWYAAGTLNRSDADRVTRALAADKSLEKRLALVREELVESIQLNESLGAPSARAMSKLFQAIDAEPARAPAGVPFATRIAEFFESLSPRTLAMSGAAAALAILLQAGVIGTMVMNNESAPAGYRTVSAPRTAPLVAGSFAMIRFAPDASAQAITQFLESNQASIVSGPNGGLYRVRIASGTIDAAQRDTLIAKLQADKTVGMIVPAE